jgi:hypothetical protein
MARQDFHCDGQIVGLAVLALHFAGAFDPLGFRFQ